MKTDLITVITVVRNDKDRIARTIGNVLNQTYPNIEYIVIDGASTDGTKEVIERYSDRLDHWLSEPDRGIYDAMNKGVDRATGKWISFMNAGDTFSDDHVLENISRELRPGADLIYGDHRVRYAGFSRIQRAKSISQLWKGIPFNHQSSLVRTELIRAYKFDLRYKLAADYDFVCHVFSSKKEFIKLEMIVADISSAGASDSDRVTTFREYREIAKRHFNDERIDLYYRYLIGFNRLKKILMNILPDQLAEKLKKAKYSVGKQEGK